MAENQEEELSEILQMDDGTADVILVCEGKEFPAHQAILCAQSEYFKEMFVDEWTEESIRKIELPTVTIRELGVILRFMYTGEIKDVEDPPLLKMLLATSHMIQIKTLFEYCCEKLTKGISCEGFLEIFNLAELYNNEEMTKTVATFLAQNFEGVSKSEEFLKMNFEQLQKVLQHPDTCKSSMDDVIKGILQWTEVDENREDSLLDNLTTIDLQMMSTEFLTGLLREKMFIKKHYHILPLLTAEATGRLLAASSEKLSALKTSQLLCFGHNDNRHVLSIFDIKKNKWRAPKLIPFQLEDCMVTVSFAGRVYFIGGGELDSYKPSEQIVEYDPATNKVIAKGQLVTPVYEAGAGVLLKNIYVVNGLDEDKKPESTVQRYDPITGICESVANTNNAHHNVKVLTYSNYLYVVGSWVQQNSVERYDPEQDVWTVITNVPGTIKRCSATIFNERLFVAQSHNLNELQIYDFEADAWIPNEIKELPEKIWDLQATMLKGKCVLIVRDDKNVLHIYEDETGQRLKKSEANMEPWSRLQTCVFK